MFFFDETTTTDQLETNNLTNFTELSVTGKIKLGLRRPNYCDNGFI